MKKNILLLTDVEPCSNYSGAILYMQLTKFLLEEKQNVCCFCVKADNIKAQISDYYKANIDFHYEDKPIEVANRTKEEKKKYLEEIDNVVDHAVSYIKEKNIDLIWCPLQGESLVLILNKVYEKTKIPYVPMYCDPLEWILKSLDYSTNEISDILKINKDIISNSQGVLAGSIFMADYIKKEYKKDSKPVYLSFNYPQRVKNVKQNEDLIISFSGQIYASLELKNFLLALKEMNFEYNGKRIIFNYYGRSLVNFLTKDNFGKYLSNINLHGYVNQNKLIRILEGSDYLYCPYFFSQDSIEKKIATYSFPSKFTSYLMCKKPIIVHAPVYSSVHKLANKYNAACFISSNNVNQIKKQLINCFKSKNDQLEENCEKLFKDNFSKEAVKKNFFDILKLECLFDSKKMLKILEVNNCDLPGRNFNGYDLQEYINNETDHEANQIVTLKTSDSKNVYELFSNEIFPFEQQLLDFERTELSVHSCLSLSGVALYNSDLYEDADIVHFHMFHNTKIPIYSLIKMSSEKHIVISIHDAWNYTGRCVHFGKCDKWKSGCHNCPNLESLFPFKEDNCSYLWNLKKLVNENSNIDFVIYSKYMYDLFQKSPIMKNKKAYYIPFGLDINHYKPLDKKECQKVFNIPENDFVLYFRAQSVLKGTDHVIKALKKLKTSKKITLLVCGENGLLDELKEKYNIIELGWIDKDIAVKAYNACDLFLMPSSGESFGFMSIEAMACEKPVIIFNNTALPAVTFAPDCGILLEDQNTEELLKAIEKYIDDDEERIKRGKLGRKLVKDNYDISEYNKKMVAMYEEVNKNEIIESEINETIDYSDINVQKIIPKLNKLYKSLVLMDYEEKFFARLDNNYYCDFPSIKSILENEIENDIDYSSFNVQQLIQDFNEFIYFKIKNIKEDIYPLVSMIIPSYNDGESLKYTIDSALSQTYINNEIIVVDIGSTDNSLEILKEYGHEIRLIREDLNDYYEAMLYGMSKSNGEYISFLFPGNAYYIGRTKILVDTMLNLCNKKIIMYHNYDTTAKESFYTTNKSKNLIHNMNCSPFLIGGFNSNTLFISRDILNESDINDFLNTNLFHYVPESLAIINNGFKNNIHRTSNSKIKRLKNYYKEKGIIKT